MRNNHSRNQAFLTNLYARGPFQGHAFVTLPEAVPLHAWEDGDYTLSQRPVDRWVPWVAENYERQLKLHEAVGDDGVPVASLMTGTHLFAAAFGCPVSRDPQGVPFARPVVRCAAEAERVAEVDLGKTPVLDRVFELAEQVRRELGPDVCLGPCDLQSGFDTASLIWDKADLFCAMMDPEQAPAVKRLVDKCAHLFKRFLVEFRRQFPNSSPCHCPGTWCPPTMGPWLSNDECGCFGAAQFEEFCLPELIDLAETFGGLGMHCCAAAEHQFPAFRRIPNFYGFNRVPARKGWEPLLEHFGGPSAPVLTLAWISDEDTARLIRRAPAGTRFLFCLLGAGEIEARAWCEKMRQVSPRTDPDP